MEKLTQKTLANGLRVVLLENHASPVASINLWANVGSVNETNEEAGLCHLIEHMLFKGTSRRAVGQIAQEVEAAGGDMNAYTSFDETVFYINLPSKNIDLALDILADAAIDPSFDQEELTREKEVVVEEISRSEDNPSQMASQDLFGKAFTTHNYRRPIAGDRETVRGVSRTHLMDFYRRWYVASNLILIVVGDFKTEELLPKINALYSNVPSGNPPSQNLAAEPSQDAPRTVVRSMDVEGRYLDIGFPIPALSHEDIPALDLLGQVLGAGASSRFEHAIKEKKQLVTSIGAYPYTPRYPCLFIVGAVLKENKLKETLQAIWEEIEKIQETPPSLVEFTRARENMKSGRIYEKQTVEALARKLGYYSGIANNLQFEETYYQKLSTLSPEDIREVARKYLHPQKATISFCHPKSESWSQEKIASFIPAEKKLPLTKKVLSVSDIQTFKLKNGIRLLIRENHNLPLVTVRSASLAGTRLETEKNNGINHMIASLLTQGTQSRNARNIAELSENLCGHISGYGGRNLLGVQGSFLAEKTTEGFDLFFDILLNPSFDEDELKKEKGHTLTMIRNENDSLGHLAMKQFLKGLYGNRSFGFSILGTEKTVKSFTTRDLTHYYQKMIHPKNIVFSVVGDVDAHDIRDRFEEKLAHWERASTKLPKIHPPKEITKASKHVLLRKKMQAHLVYGFLGTTIKAKDRYALEVLNFVLAGQGGRLFIELRDKQSLAYTISSSSHEGIERGYFSVYMGTDPSKLDTALQGIYRELEKIRTELVSPDELDRAKRFITGSYLMDLQKNSAVASLMVLNDIYGLSSEEVFEFPKRIDAVTREEVLHVAKKYLKPKASVLSIVKP